jgi:O-antigen ligase
MRGIIKKITIAILFILLLVCLAMTYSRASWLGFILSFALIIYYLYSLLNKRVKILFIFTVIFSIITFLAIPQTVKNKIWNILPKNTIERIASITQIENSGLFRLNLWKESLEIIEDFPLFGVGLNTYSKIGPKYSKAGGGYYPHNSYLQMAAEIGILGLFSFLWILINLFRIGIRTLKNNNDKIILGFLAALLAFLTQSFFDVNLYALQLATLFWFVLGLAATRINMLS